MSMESANTALADSPEQRPLKSIFAQPASGRELQPAEADTVDSSGSVPLRDKTERFARDINAKIDALEEQIERSTRQMAQNHEQIEHRHDLLALDHESLRSALEELHGHLAHQRSELDAQRDSLNASRDALSTQGNTLALQHEELHHQGDLLRHQQQTLDAQQASLDQQRKALDQLSQNLSAHTGALSTHTSALSTHNERLEQQESLLSTHSAQLDALDQRQLDQQQSLLGLSQEHDATTARVDALADQLYDSNVQLASQRNETRSHLRTLAAALAGTTLLTLGLIGYFAFNPIATTATVESNLASLNAGLEQQREKTATLSGEMERVGAGLTTLEGNLDDLRNSQGELQSGQQASREDISRISSQISQYERTLSELRNRVQRAQASPGVRAATPAGSVAIRDSTWFASRPANHYVIQLVSAGDYNGVVRFANKNARGLSRYPLSAVMTRRQGQAWHHLMYGDFATRQQAQNALAALPAELRAAKPWIRQIRSVR